MKYLDLNALLRSESETKCSYDALLDYAKEQVNTRLAGVNSLASMEDYAENFTQGTIESKTVSTLFIWRAFEKRYTPVLGA